MLPSPISRATDRVIAIAAPGLDTPGLADLLACARVGETAGGEDLFGRVQNRENRLASFGVGWASIQLAESA